ncbi:DUF418 domain-containing protein [Sphingomonas sp.]|uniref:DUF418 domain-containing protein n=1 Tax=Sphingomonas sp. TaxID=28214 RepID=UPI0017A3F6D7|nr:DUF418 domain-containing protein [Sphingomonas sp.]MBA3510777.1 DUF418 domain-containing protein [Sphingomonas sp.]
MTDTTKSRILTLDIVRGVAVMGILAMNIVAFAMPPQAYLNPLAYGTESAADLASWAFSFVFVDGKMRGLFSLLFGASMMLVIQLAEKSADSPKRVTFARQLWLLLFGMIHYYFIWYGDILIGYALIGMVAWFFRGLEPRALVRWGIALVTVQLLIMGGGAAYAHSLSAAAAAPGAGPETLKEWAEFSHDMAIPSAAVLREELALFLGPWTGIVEYQLTEKALMPLFFTFLFGPETLAYMLFGMAALKCGFLTGAWDNARYRGVAITALAVAIPVYVLLAALLLADDFSVPGIFTYSFAATVPFRPLMIIAYAALIILATRRGGWLVDRIAATGRAAFSNYLGTSILMTGLFFGWGLGWFGSVSRIELWLVVAAMWLVMLAWSKPWLERFAYGPLEWLWRSLARRQLQPFRKRRAATPVAAGA